MVLKEKLIRIKNRLVYSELCNAICNIPSYDCAKLLQIISHIFELIILDITEKNYHTESFGLYARYAFYGLHIAALGISCFHLIHRQIRSIQTINRITIEYAIAIPMLVFFIVTACFAFQSQGNNRSYIFLILPGESLWFEVLTIALLYNAINLDEVKEYEEKFMMDLQKYRDLMAQNRETIKNVGQIPSMKFSNRFSQSPEQSPIADETVIIMNEVQNSYTKLIAKKNPKESLIVNLNNNQDQPTTSSEQDSKVHFQPKVEERSTCNLRSITNPLPNFNPETPVHESQSRIYNSVTFESLLSAFHRVVAFVISKLTSFLNLFRNIFSRIFFWKNNWNIQQNNQKENIQNIELRDFKHSPDKSQKLN